MVLMYSRPVEDQKIGTARKQVEVKPCDAPAVLNGGIANAQHVGFGGYGLCFDAQERKVLC